MKHTFKNESSYVSVRTDVFYGNAAFNSWVFELI